MKKDRITELITISLMTTLFNTTSIFTAEPEHPIHRINHTILNYTDPAIMAQKEVVFAISSGVKKIHEVAGNFLNELYNPYNSTDPKSEKFFAENLVKAIEEERKKLSTRLNAAQGLESERILRFFDGLYKRIIIVYKPFFERFDILKQSCLDNPFMGDCSGNSNTEIYIPRVGAIDISTISLAKGKEEAQLGILQDICNLSRDINEAKAFAPTTTHFDTYQLLMHVSGTYQLKCDTKIFLLTEAVNELYTAYSTEGPTSEAIGTLEFQAAKHLKFSTKKVANPVRFAMPADNSIMHVVVAFTGPEETDITFADVIDVLGKNALKAEAILPPPPQYVRMFTEVDDIMLQQIAETDARIQRSLQTTGRTPAGWSKAEEIMDYGSEGKTSITPEVRQGVENLLHDQFKRRGIVLQPMRNVVVIKGYQKFVGQPAVIDTLKSWFAELNMDNAAALNDSLEYVVRNSSYGSVENTGLLESLWELQNTHAFYSKWPEETEKINFLNNMYSTIVQSLTHLEDHKGKCATGARGRTFLIRLGMLNFFKDHHPNLKVA